MKKSNNKNKQLNIDLDKLKELYPAIDLSKMDKIYQIDIDELSKLYPNIDLREFEENLKKPLKK